ncbi:hypothetical protein JXI42_00215 [bacterium]|nr:hypothetical protein [bacterium]
MRRAARLLLILFILINVGMLNAEIRIMQFPMPADQIDMRQIWRFDVNSQEEDSIPVYFKCEMTKVGDGAIVKGSSKKFVLSMGMKSFVPDDLGEITYEWSQKDYKQMIESHETPSGEYKICIHVINADTDIELASGCTSQYVRDKSKIGLMNPANKEDIGDLYPYFNWADSEPYEPDRKFIVKICELKEGQKPESAMSGNKPVFMFEETKSTSFRYPISAEPLKGGHTYVWEVTHTEGDIAKTKSPVWQFTIIDMPDMEKVQANIKFTELNAEIGSIFLPINGQRMATGPITITLTPSDKVKVSTTGRIDVNSNKGEIRWPITMNCPLFKELGIGPVSTVLIGSIHFERDMVSCYNVGTINLNLNSDGSKEPLMLYVESKNIIHVESDVPPQKPEIGSPDNPPPAPGTVPEGETPPPEQVMSIQPPEDFVKFGVQTWEFKDILPADGRKDLPRLWEMSEEAKTNNEIVMHGKGESLLGRGANLHQEFPYDEFLFYIPSEDGYQVSNMTGTAKVEIK